MFLIFIRLFKNDLKHGKSKWLNMMMWSRSPKSTTIIDSLNWELQMTISWMVPGLWICYLNLIQWELAFWAISKPWSTEPSWSWGQKYDSFDLLTCCTNCKPARKKSLLKLKFFRFDCFLDLREFHKMIKKKSFQQAEKEEGPPIVFEWRERHAIFLCWLSQTSCCFCITCLQITSNTQMYTVIGGGPMF